MAVPVLTCAGPAGTASRWSTTGATRWSRCRRSRCPCAAAQTMPIPHSGPSTPSCCGCGLSRTHLARTAVASHSTQQDAAALSGAQRMNAGHALEAILAPGSHCAPCTEPCSAVHKGVCHQGSRCSQRLVLGPRSAATASPASAATETVACAFSQPTYSPSGATALTLFLSSGASGASGATGSDPSFESLGWQCSPAKRRRLTAHNPAAAEYSALYGHQEGPALGPQSPAAMGTARQSALAEDTSARRALLQGGVPTAAATNAQLPVCTSTQIHCTGQTRRTICVASACLTALPSSTDMPALVRFM